MDTGFLLRSAQAGSGYFDAPSVKWLARGRGWSDQRIARRGSPAVRASLAREDSGVQLYSTLYRRETNPRQRLDWMHYLSDAHDHMLGTYY
jgi:hypothetical protein